MRKFNFDEIDDIAAQVARNDMARAAREPLPQPPKPEPVSSDETGTWRGVPVFLRPQAE